MTLTRTLVEKETRALLGVWLTALAGAVFAEFSGLRGYRDFEILAWIVGATALGATTIGHEYRYGTLAPLLAQPVGRRRLLTIKMAVTAVLLLALAAAMLMVPLASPAWRGSNREVVPALVILPIAYALSVAPWLAIRVRSAVAATLFTGSIGAMLYIGSVVWASRNFHAMHEVEDARLRILWIGSGLLCAGAAWGLWRAFPSLELSEGQSGDIQLFAPVGRRARSAGVRRGHPVWALVKKEIHLQQLTLAASALFAAGTIFHALALPGVPVRREFFAVMTAIHAIVVATLAGALSSAQERAMGTLESQLLQPRSVRAQFAVKLAATFGLALLLVFGVPALVSPIVGASAWQRTPTGTDFLNLCLLFAGGVYLSSLASSGLTALLLCIPSFLAITVLYGFLDRAVFHPVFAAFHRLPNGGFDRPASRLPDSIDIVVGLAFVALVLWFALQNHRDAGRSVRRAAVQVGVVVGLFTIVFAAFAAAGRVI